MFVHIPVDAAKGFPASVKVISILNIGIRLAEVTEAGPYLQVFGDVVTRVQFNQHLRNFGYNITGGVDARSRSVTESNPRLIFLVFRALVSKQEVEIKSFERLHNRICCPTDGFNIIAQCCGFDILIIVGVNQIQCRVVICLGNISEQGSQAEPVIIEIDTGTSQRNSYLIYIRHLGRCKVRHIRTLGIVSEIGSETKLLRHLISSGCRECHIEPIITITARGNLGAVGCNRPDVIIGKTAYRFSVCIVHSQILSCQTLVFKTSAIIHIPFISNIPIVSSIKSQLIFMAFIVFRSILIQIIIWSITIMMNVFGISTVKNLRIFFYRMVVHRGV